MTDGPPTARHRAPAWSPFLRGSAGWHVAMAAGWLWHPQAWPWWLGGLVLNHAVLTTAGLLPRSDWLGPNWRHLPTDGQRPPSIALTFDDGPDPAVTPFVLDELARRGMRATFFCIGQRVQANADLARAIVAHGHDIENHTQHHRLDFARFGPRRLQQEILDAQLAIADVAGRTPAFFRAPAGLRSPLLQPVLARLDLQLAAWSRRAFDTVNKDPSAVVRTLVGRLAADDILLLHDGHAARAADGLPVLREVLPRVLDHVAASGLRTLRLRDALPVVAAPIAPPAGATGSL